VNPKLLRVVWFLLALSFVIWLASADIAFADDDCRGNQNCTDTGGGDIDITGGDVNVPVDVTTGPVNVESPVSVNHESKALALSNSLGDVDIAGCLGSTQWATPLFSKQKLVVNWPCLAEFYLRNGKYELAAVAICNTEIVKEFADEASCEAAHDFSPATEPVSEVIEVIEGQREQAQSIAVVQMAQYELEERIEALEKKPAPRPRVVQAAPPPEKDELTLAEKEAILATLLYDPKGKEEDE
jgi:hypothetical protein